MFQVTVYLAPYYLVRAHIEKWLLKQRDKKDKEVRNRKYPRFAGFRTITLLSMIDLTCVFLHSERIIYTVSTPFEYYSAIFLAGIFLSLFGMKVSRYINLKQDLKKDEYQKMVSGIPYPILKLHLETDDDLDELIAPGTEINPIFYFRKECSRKWCKAQIYYRRDQEKISSFYLMELERAKLQLETLPNKQSMKEDIVFEQLRGNHVQVIGPTDLWTS